MSNIDESMVSRTCRSAQSDGPFDEGVPIRDHEHALICNVHKARMIRIPQADKSQLEIW